MKKPKAIKTPPSKEELANRLENVKQLMAQEALDYYVCFDPVNIYYLTNFAFYVHERPFLLIIDKKGLLKMVAPLLEAAHIRDRAIAQLELIEYNEFPAPEGENWYDKYQQILENSATIGIEPSMPMEIFQKTPGTKKISSILEEVRLIKSEYEIGRLVHASKIVSRGHKKILQLCKPDAAEFALYQEATSAMTSKIIMDIPNANFKATETTAAVWPPNISHEPHLVPNIFAKMEEGGPHVSIVQARVDGYGAEIERTFFLNSVPDKARKPFEIIMNARSLAYDLLKPGMMMSEIDKEVKNLLNKNGYADFILHRTGHGFGVTSHEAPYLAEGYDRILEPNMVVSIEPGIYIPGIGGFRHSDTVLLTEDGYLKLTKAPEELEELTLKRN
jgi:Xaa-Pro dipeptidase